VRPRELLTVEQLLDNARYILLQLQSDSQWAAYGAVRPGRVQAVEGLLGTINTLERETTERANVTPRSVALNVWSLAKRHAASLDHFASSRVLSRRGGLANA
jgi:hypothetical protein